jgi:hypothetical protein
MNIIENARYANAAHSVILATVNGEEVSIPVAPGNKEYDEIVSQGLAVAAYTPPAITWADIRSKRDGLLAETDWVVVKAQETGEAVPAAWATYRQALRDLPANTADPANPVWPTKP